MKAKYEIEIETITQEIKRRHLSLVQEQLEVAKILWQKANRQLNLDPADLKGYFYAIGSLCKYINENKVNVSELKLLLKDEEITLKAGTLLQQIHASLLSYSLKTTSRKDPNAIESNSIGMINKLSTFFMDCKLDQNEAAKEAPQFKLPLTQIIIPLMEFIKEAASPHDEIMNNSFQEIMQAKIEKLNSEEFKSFAPASPGFYEALKRIYSYKGSLVRSHYEHATLTEGRWYNFFKASTENFPSLKGKYPELSGDRLKTAILIDLEKELEKALNSKEDFVNIETRLRNSDEFKVLQASQSVLTWLSGGETSSVKAFNQIVEKVKATIKEEEKEQSFFTPKSKK